MTEEVRHEIVQRRQSGQSLRAIAEELGISRGAVARALARVQAQRDGRAAPSPRSRPRKSIIDPFEPILKELLAKYPNLTTERALQELQARGFTGKYTVVRQRMALLRPRAAAPPVPRFETGPGAQAQMDYGVYDLDFNRAYHPYCVYDPGWICPYPPSENRLEIAIRAGERLQDVRAQ